MSSAMAAAVQHYGGGRHLHRRSEINEAPNHKDHDPTMDEDQNIFPVLTSGSFFNKSCQTIEDNDSLMLSFHNSGQETKIAPDCETTSETEATSGCQSSSCSGSSGSDVKTIVSYYSSHPEVSPVGRKRMISQSLTSSPPRIVTFHEDLEKFQQATTPPRGNKTPVHLSPIRSTPVSTPREALSDVSRSTASNREKMTCILGDHQQITSSALAPSSGRKTTSTDTVSAICHQIERLSQSCSPESNQHSLYETNSQVQQPCPHRQSQLRARSKLLNSGNEEEMCIPPPPLFQKRRTFTINDEDRPKGRDLQDSLQTNMAKSRARLQALSLKAKHETASNHSRPAPTFKQRNTFTINEENRTERRTAPPLTPPQTCRSVIRDNSQLQIRSSLKAKHEMSAKKCMPPATQKRRTFTINEEYRVHHHAQASAGGNHALSRNGAHGRSKEGSVVQSPRPPVFEKRRTCPSISQEVVKSSTKQSPKKNEESKRHNDCPNHGTTPSLRKSHKAKLENENRQLTFHKRSTFSTIEERRPREPPARRLSHHSNKDDLMPNPANSSSRIPTNRGKSENYTIHSRESYGNLAGVGEGRERRRRAKTSSPNSNSKKNSGRQEPQFDKIQGCCPRHPFVTIAKKTPFSSRWEIVRDHCPLCAKFETNHNTLKETPEDGAACGYRRRSSILDSVFRLANRARGKKSSKIRPDAPAQQERTNPRSYAEENKRTDVEQEINENYDPYGVYQISEYHMMENEKTMRTGDADFNRRRISRLSDTTVVEDLKGQTRTREPTIQDPEGYHNKIDRMNDALLPIAKPGGHNATATAAVHYDCGACSTNNFDIIETRINRVSSRDNSDVIPKFKRSSTAPAGQNLSSMRKTSFRRSCTAPVEKRVLDPASNATSRPLRGSSGRRDVENLSRDAASKYNDTQPRRSKSNGRTNLVEGPFVGRDNGDLSMAQMPRIGW